MRSLAIVFLLVFAVIGCKTASLRSVDTDEDSGEPGSEDVKGIVDVVVPEIIIQDDEDEVGGGDKGDEGDGDGGGDDGGKGDLPPEQQNCTNTKPIMLAAPLAFTERKDCKFGYGNNLGKKEGYLQAIESQIKRLELPPVKELCSLKIESERNDLHYDDYFFLTVDDRILVSSEIRWTDFFDDQDTFKVFDFMKIRGENHRYVEGDKTYGTPYCYYDEECLVPDHDKTGPFKLSLTVDAMADLSKLALDKPYIDFKATASGDNNSADCDFSSFDLKLTMEYIPMP